MRLVLVVILSLIHICLLECIENNKTTILAGKLPLLVAGYCNSLGSEAEDRATAKIRANRVKSELIIRAEIKEENFITRNHANCSSRQPVAAVCRCV